MRQWLPQGQVSEHELTQFFMKEAVPDGYVWCGNMRAAYLIDKVDSQIEGFVRDPLDTIQALKFGKAPFFAAPKGGDQLIEEDIAHFRRVTGHSGPENMLDPVDLPPTDWLVRSYMIGLYRGKAELGL